LPHREQPAEPRTDHDHSMCLVSFVHGCPLPTSVVARPTPSPYDPRPHDHPAGPVHPMWLTGSRVCLRLGRSAGMRLRSRYTHQRRPSGVLGARPRAGPVPRVGGIMNIPRGQVLVLYGIAGDLAKKMLIPALYRLTARGVLDVPVIGVDR